MWTFCCCMTTNNIAWKNFFKNMCTNIYVSDVKSFNIWAQICDQTARAGNWQKWRFQTFFFIFIINLYKCGKMYFILIIHHRVKCRASILGFCIFEHLRKRFFPPQIGASRSDALLLWENTIERKIGDLDFKKC